MNKRLLIGLVLVAIALVFACNKQKPVVLDYEKGGQSKMYDQKGLPGESHVGTPPEDFKHRGYKPSEGETAKKETKKKPKKEPKKEEKKPTEKQPAPKGTAETAEEKKPEEKQSEEKK